MIAIRKLMTLSPVHRARKAAQSLGHIEADWRLGDRSAAPWVVELAAAFAADMALPEELRRLAREVSASMPAAAADGGTGGASAKCSGVRLVNRLARALEAHAGLSPADWDFREPLGTSLPPAPAFFSPVSGLTWKMSVHHST